MLNFHPSQFPLQQHFSPLICLIILHILTFSYPFDPYDAHYCLCSTLPNLSPPMWFSMVRVRLDCSVLMSWTNYAGPLNLDERTCENHLGPHKCRYFLVSSCCHLIVTFVSLSSAGRQAGRLARHAPVTRVLISMYQITLHPWQFLRMIRSNLRALSFCFRCG